MKTLIGEKAFNLWDEWWDQLKEEWLKVEILQDYSGENSGRSLDLWKRGEKEKSLQILKEELKNSEWAKMLNANPKVKKIRIHIVEEPYSSYLQWEIEVYKLNNIPAGEQVGLVSKADVKDLALPDGDFMIFDNKQVVRNYYDANGTCYKMDFYEENDDISNFLELRRKLIEVAKPLE